MGRVRGVEWGRQARWILSEEAAGVGLGNRAAPADDLLKEARAMAAMMAEKRPEVLAAAKRVLEYGETHSMEESMRNEERASGELRKARQG